VVMTRATWLVEAMPGRSGRPDHSTAAASKLPHCILLTFMSAGCGYSTHAKDIKT